MASIYNIANWDEDYSDTYGNYKINDIVKDGADFWYCIKSHASSIPNKPEVGSIYWDGRQEVREAGTDSVEPFFFWAPSYNLAMQQEPRVLSIAFGDGYEQRLPDGINNDLLQFSLTFDKRSTEETAAIIHFFSSKKGVKPFFFRAPHPYGITKKFICKNWSSTLVFEDHYTIAATFTEKS
tara:strand:- start:1563 stop:2105 length:543 start_codon:yes stop_codon:yes gene_type:complete